MKKRKILIIMFILFIIIGVGMTIYFVKRNEYHKTKMEKIFENVEERTAILTEYIVYGTHLNIKGEISDDVPNIKNVNLILASIDGKEEKIELNYEENEDLIMFYTSDIINEGINLEKMSVSEHYMLIEIEYEKYKNAKRYSIENDTKYDEILYYTITKNNLNNKINIKFDTYSLDDKNIKFMFMNVKHAKLPKDVYDIVIDPGHGGSDNGAEYGGYAEADLTLEYGKKLKKELEKLGLKVKITRDGTEDKENFGTKNVYDENGRVNIVRGIKGKVCFVNSLK